MLLLGITKIETGEIMKLKFSKDDNKKLKAIKEWSEIENPKVYSLSLLSGFSCPKALDCSTYAVANKITGKRTVLDGKHAKFRCFSAIQEAQYPNVYDQRKHNFDLLRKLDDEFDMATLINDSLPKNADYIRIHVAGDFFSKAYMTAWHLVARVNPNIKFYAYTKSIQWMYDLEDQRPSNLRIIASYGSKEDSLIDELNLDSARVIFHPSERGNLPIDKNEYHAINRIGNGSFVLLLHGTQKQGSIGSEALKRMNKENINYSYS